jgi:hypothetical protein
MSALLPTTLAAAGAIMAPKLGKQWPLARRDVVASVNKFRSRIFKELQPESDLATIWFRVCPQSYHDGGISYNGFSLPREMAGLTGVWRCTQPLAVGTEWRESYEGLEPSGRSLTPLTNAGSYPTERGLRCASNLRFYSESDTGTVVARGFDSTGKRLTTSIALRKDEWMVTPQLYRRIESIVLPTLSNRVILADNEGYELSHYMPGETVPSYPRYKYNNTCGECASLIIRGPRQFVEIGCDTSVVEIGDREVLENAATWIRYENSKDRAEQDLSQIAEARMVRAIQQALTTARGVEKRGPVWRPRKPAGKPLYRNTYR